MAGKKKMEYWTTSEYISLKSKLLIYDPSSPTPGQYLFKGDISTMIPSQYRLDLIYKFSLMSLYV
jgi:hypothetical protein